MLTGGSTTISVSLQGFRIDFGRFFSLDSTLFGGSLIIHVHNCGLSRLSNLRVDYSTR